MNVKAKRLKRISSLILLSLLNAGSMKIMKRNEKIFLLLFLISIFFFKTLNAQQSDTGGKPDYAKDPVWIAMMDDPNVNYYEALKAYEVYWKNHDKPADEEELMNEGKEGVSREEEREREREIKREKKLTPAQKQSKNRMRYDCKRFENWKHEVFPFVQPDGKILSQQERLKIWKDQQEQLKKQEQK